jgi:hypothetical protein
MTEAPETPNEEIPQDPGTTVPAGEEEQSEEAPGRLRPEREETGTDAAGRTPRHRAGD